MYVHTFKNIGYIKNFQMEEGCKWAVEEQEGPDGETGHLWVFPFPAFRTTKTLYVETDSGYIARLILNF